MNKNNALLDQLLSDNSPTQRPFPGKYPTRVWLASAGAVKFEYFGKPVPGLLNLVRKQFTLKGGRLGHLTMHEFDQNGIVAVVRGGLFDWISTFYNTYMPFQRNLRDNLYDYGVYYYLLNREVIEVAGKRIYWPKVFDGKVYEDTARTMLADCVRGRVAKSRFGTATTQRILLDIGEAAAAWTKVKVVTQKDNPLLLKLRGKPWFKRRPQPMPKPEAPVAEWPTMVAMPQPPKAFFLDEVVPMQVPDEPPTEPEQPNVKQQLDWHFNWAPVNQILNEAAAPPQPKIPTEEQIRAWYAKLENRA